MRVAADILDVLGRAVTDGRRLVLPGALDRATYVAVNRVLELAGGTWSRTSRAHLFEGEACDAVDQILLTGEVTNAKQEFGRFWSPPPVVKRVIALADIRGHHRVLEPSAGRGDLAFAAAGRCAFLQCFEIDRDLAAGLGRLPGVNRLWCGDFLGTKPTGDFDRVIMNPPFARRADIAHVEHALKFLCRGGRLVSVMSAGLLFRQDRSSTTLRNVVRQHGGTIEVLPEGSFRASGTMVNAVIVAVTKGAAPPADLSAEAHSAKAEALAEAGHG